MPKRFLSNNILKNLLENATEEELLSLTKLLNPENHLPYTSTKLQEEICLEGGHGVINVFWRFGDGTGYLDIVDEVLDELNIYSLPSYDLKVKYYDEINYLEYSKEEAVQKGIEYVEEAEESIILKLLEITYENMSEDEKLSFDEQMNKIAEEFNSNATQNLTGVAGLIALGNIGGFATYTFLTTAMSTITIGTLGFSAYTAATSLLSFLLGPPGWTALGIATVFTVGKPNYQKLIPIVAIIGAIRQRIKYERIKSNKTSLLISA